MMKVKRERIEELYGLYEEKTQFSKECMDVMCEDLDDPRAVVFVKKANEVDERIKVKLSMIKTESDLATATFIKKLMDAVAPFSLSRCMKCLEVCGVEVEG